MASTWGDCLRERSEPANKRSLLAKACVVTFGPGEQLNPDICDMTRETPINCAATSIRQGKTKHTWRMIPRVLPAKRSVSERIRDFREIDLLFDEATVREQASRCLQCPDPLCRTGCPLANRIPEWLGLATEGHFLEAAAVSQQTSNMPASRKEYLNASDEGARFLFLTNPVALEGNACNEVALVQCLRMEPGPPEAGGRRKPRAVPGSEFEVPADVVLVAFGFDPATFPSGSDLAEIATNDWGGVIVDGNQMTNLPGVFSGGDHVRGPSLVVHAIRDGRRAALAIDQYLSGT